jgi:hypothetical protein
MLRGLVPVAVFGQPHLEAEPAALLKSRLRFRLVAKLQQEVELTVGNFSLHARYYHPESASGPHVRWPAIARFWQFLGFCQELKSQSPQTTLREPKVRTPQRPSRLAGFSRKPRVSNKKPPSGGFRIE